MALHQYHEANGRLPPAVVYGADGQALYSWRVLILPFLGEDHLFNEFRLDEAWDSPHNITLLPRMPKTYASPSRKALPLPPNHTICHVFVGYDAAFQVTDGLRFDADFPDGLSNTLLVVETGAPVPWTKPEDLFYSGDRPLPDLRGIFPDGFRARTADASGRWIECDMTEPALRALITRNGNESQ